MLGDIPGVEDGYYTNKSVQGSIIHGLGMRMAGHTSHDGHTLRHWKSCEALQNVASFVSGTDRDNSWEVALHYKHEH